MRTSVSVLLVFWLTAAANAGTQVSLWHSYTNQATEVHFGFGLKNYKRGLFFGSCGPSTYSLQWEYGFDLKGEGPQVARGAIELKNANFHPVAIESRNIVVDE